MILAVLYEIWEILKGNENCGVTIRTLKTFLLAFKGI